MPLNAYRKGYATLHNIDFYIYKANFYRISLYRSHKGSHKRTHKRTKIGTKTVPICEF